MLKLSLLAVGAAATSVTLFDDPIISLDLEYYVQSDELYFISTQTLNGNIDATELVQVVFLTEDITYDQLKLIDDDEFEGPFPFEFTDGILA